jgi:hypothetical protein
MECEANAAYEPYQARGVDKNGKKFGWRDRDGVRLRWRVAPTA